MNLGRWMTIRSGCRGGDIRGKNLCMGWEIISTTPDQMCIRDRDLTSPNFGVQEFFGFSDLEREIFRGCPEVKDGYLYPNEKPGFGIEFDEELANRYPCQFRDHGWLQSRLPDGTAVRP